MNGRAVVKKLAVTAVVVALAFGTYAWAQNQPATVVLPANGMGNLQTSMGPVNVNAANDHDVRVNTLANDTFVVVKDVTDSQIVFVYRVDQLGKVTLADKKRFYY